jgi:hypothetical protein
LGIQPGTDEMLVWEVLPAITDEIVGRTGFPLKRVRAILRDFRDREFILRMPMWQLPRRSNRCGRMWVYVAILRRNGDPMRCGS